jgi:hypothetical protein
MEIIMEINRLISAPSAGQITGGGMMASGNADTANQNLGESYYFTLIRVLGGDPMPPIITSVIEPYMQGYQKGNRLIDSIDSIV